MQLEDKTWPRALFLASAYLAASGSFFLYYMYLGWLLFDFILKTHSRPNWYIVTKVLLLLAYDIVCTWFISDLLPGVYAFWATKRNSEEVEIIERPEEENEKNVF